MAYKKISAYARCVGREIKKVRATSPQMAMKLAANRCKKIHGKRKPYRHHRKR
jgi:hypothetical protein